VLVHSDAKAYGKGADQETGYRETALTQERLRFLNVLSDICLGEKLFKLQRNPVKDLYQDLSKRRADVENEIYSKYRDPLTEGLLLYSTHKLLERRLNDVTSEVINNWARRNRLFAPNCLEPPLWIAKWAEDTYLQRPKPLDAFMPPGAAYSEHRIVHSRIKRLKDTLMPAPSPWPLNLVSLAESPRRKGEKFDPYINRLCRENGPTVKAFFRAKLTRRAAPHSLKGRRKHGNYEAAHYRFLALRICGVSRKVIFESDADRWYSDPSTITKGVKALAQRIGLRPPIKK
jgi:hypothetical protein